MQDPKPILQGTPVHGKREKTVETLSPVSVVDASAGRLSLKDWVRQFTRPMRGRPDHLILDEFDCEFFLIFNFEEDPETPASHDTCDIQIVPLEAEDFLAESIRLVANAKQHDVMRLLAALGVQRFSDKVKTAYYGTVGSPLRGASHDI